ncbi:MAG: hypothetical protein DRJ65_02190 [Acidobacteria bacterium]|nr:MAG: hypothetical protein DRJ65_02190 [Acidobacteriota bacterium]
MQRAQEFDRIYGHLLEGKARNTLTKFLDATAGPISRRWRYALSNDLYKQNPTEHLTLKLLLLLNLL